MMPVRLHPDAERAFSGGGDAARPVVGPTPAAGGRLNLLLSYGGWEPEPWVDRLPKLLEPMGVRSLRAGSGTEATRVIREHTVHIAVVDLGLPMDGPASPGGTKLLEMLRRLEAPPPTVVVKESRQGGSAARQMAAALRAGAFAVVDRPRDARDLEVMLGVFRRCLTRFYRDRWPGAAGPGA